MVRVDIGHLVHYSFYARGVDNIDVELFELAVNRFSEANRLMESVTDKTRALCQ